MKILVTGANGQLGYDVLRVLRMHSINCLGVDRNDFDILNKEQAKRFIFRYNPDVIVHCAAYTAVDRAEEDCELCLNINADGSKNLAMISEQIGAKMVYISTDYVFGSNSNVPLEVNDFKRPLNVYGRSKLMGENAVLNICSRPFIIRTSWVFGLNGCNFVKSMTRLSECQSSITVVDDQIGSPTYTYDLAKLIYKMILTDKYGIYHATNENYCSWAEFAEKIMQYSSSDVEVIPITSKQFNSKAKRPHNSRLSKSSLTENGFDLLPPWQDALKRYFDEIHVTKLNYLSMLG